MMANKKLTCVCGSTDLIKAGFSINRSGKHQRYLCRFCGRIHVSKRIVQRDMKLKQDLEVI